MCAHLNRTASYFVYYQVIFKQSDYQHYGAWESLMGRMFGEFTLLTVWQKKFDK